MKVLEVQLNNIRAIDSLHWKLPKDQSPNGWHVVLGDNGSGKSSFLRALAVGFLGVERSAALWLDFNEWLRRPATKGSISIAIQPEEDDEIALLTGNAPFMVLGVGSEGYRVAKYMSELDMKNVEFVACDTDKAILGARATIHKIYVDGQSLAEAGLNRQINTKKLSALRKQFRMVLGNGTKALLLIADTGNRNSGELAPIIRLVAS